MFSEVFLPCRSLAPRSTRIACGDFIENGQGCARTPPFFAYSFQLDSRSRPILRVLVGGETLVRVRFGLSETVSTTSDTSRYVKFPANTAYPHGLSAPACGTANEPGEGFCGECGAQLQAVGRLAVTRLGEPGESTQTANR
jgi:hypothetical protein